MKESIFRKESLEKINSPGELNRYIRVAEPGMWIALAAIIVLLLGAVVWGVFGVVETSVPAWVQAEDGRAICCLDVQEAAGVQPGMVLRAGGAEGRVLQISGQAGAVPAWAALQAEACILAEAELTGLADGIYEGSVIVEALAPITFVTR